MSYLFRPGTVTPYLPLRKTENPVHKLMGMIMLK
jgi:hypothetical protein